METAKILSFPASFTKEDIEHCLNCLSFVYYSLDDDTDGQPFHISSGDLNYLVRLLHRDYNCMRSVIEASEFSGDDK